ncbi:hypothetical protein ACGGKE_11950 [Sphingobium naphthae]|uniref:hypothetical protein n=1 Tax=Sphingobium naphthae TaxID=1886786 RepID=UPI0037494B17
MPFFHAVTLTRDHLIREAVGSVLLLGTKFTMEDDFFAGPLAAAGIRVIVPDASEREEIQAIQSRLARGEMEESFREYVKRRSKGTPDRRRRGTPFSDNMMLVC